MPNLLVIEDELNVSSFIKKGFEEEGYTVDVAYDGAMGLKLIVAKEYDAVILDVVLPQINGLDVCHKIREVYGYKLPILMLTALGTSDDIIKGLEIGADDYLVKPFKFKELLARVKVMLRRGATGSVARVYNIAGVELNVDTKTVIRDGKVIPLTSKEYYLLEFLMANHKRVLSRTTIFEKVWDTNQYLGTNIVEVYIKYLRNKIDKGFEKKLIHTVIGMGYVFKEE
jgi:DNA-binding response OmpR family regulator